MSICDVMPVTEERFLSNVVFMGIDIPLSEIERLFHILDSNFGKPAKS